MIIFLYYFFEEYYFVVLRKNDIFFIKGVVFILWWICLYLIGCINWIKIYFIFIFYLCFVVLFVFNCIMIREEKEN